MFGDFFRIIPRPPLRALVPNLAMLAVYLMTRDGLDLGAGPVPGVALGVLFFVVLSLGGSIMKRVEEGRVLQGVFLAGVLLLGVAALGVIVPSVFQVQVGWVIVAILFAVGFAGFVFFGDETDLSALPSAWARYRSDPERRSALSVVAARHAFDTMVAAALLRWASVDLWVVYVSCGRLMSWYVAEAVIYHILVRARDA
ncbi:hypothetical protein [Maritimibacter dapengensis]|uniref:Intracellular septation protein A n=1 Tax=Maritimibacter dapengensis TaxID=2836868 RepID=A0ABS6T0J3_9RHOB|nr:hypothetical protein [Maritimibacter dapengensis]MBV7378757.1 hypothetical protein [Maritimibacter dapengensis]